VLCLAEGQGRNALYISKQYHHAKVVAVDYSEIGVKITNELAAKEGVSERLCAFVADLSEYDLLTHCPDEGYDLIISIFAHTPSTIRQQVHANLAKALTANGHFILQAYTPANIGRGTGGPQAADYCMNKESLLTEVEGFAMLELEESESIIDEGKYHQGLAATVQGVWQKL
jgi:SAM-dependent methyltransferase